VGFRLAEVFEEYRVSVERAREDVARFEKALETVRVLDALAQLAPSTVKGEIAGRLGEARSYAVEGDAKAALEALEAACRRAAAAAASTIASVQLREGGCPDARSVRLVKAMLDASGPLSVIVSTLLAAGAAGADDFYSNALGLAGRWQQVSKLLVDFYNAARRLERRGYGSWSDLALVVSRLSRGSSLNDSLSRLEEAVRSLEELARLADELAGGAAEAAEALAACREYSEKLGELPVCRWLTSLIDSLMAAGEALKTLPTAESRVELGGILERVRDAYERLTAGRRMAEKLLGRLRGHYTAAKPLVEIVEALFEARAGLGFSDVEEELMIALGERDKIDMLELSEKGEAYVRAALNLCKHGIAVCELKMY
jgi:methyl-accepting chemotaxis protein